jgi:hypothetical protein
MKANKYLVGMSALCMLASLACGLSDNLINKAIGGDGNMQTVSSLWSDVPPMDGLQHSEMEDMPPFVKLALRLVLGNLGRLNGAGEDQTTGNIDWIAFTTDKSPQDVQNFYTNDLMTSNGWDSNESSPCISGSDQGTTEVGVVCVFGKSQTSPNVQLAIITAQDPQTKQTTVFYLRLEESATPVPAATQ